jgi:tetraacyldisaccharide 4'-kinase
MVILKIILLPLSYLYGIILFLRNKLFDWGILESTRFNVPIISVGNLNWGGTGKTPHIEYLIRLLKPTFYIATLSRGYGRKTTGFLIADTQSESHEVGDEPLQFKKKFPNVRVAVDEKRVHGIHEILKLYPSIQSILLDDAFQHRYVTPGLSILLTDFNHLYCDDYVIPSGTLREFRTGAKRADIIIVTKCPQLPLPIERENIIQKIKPLPHQKVFFSCICYGEFMPINSNATIPFSKDYYFERNYTILLFSGIANVQALEYYLTRKTNNVISVKFKDHHIFSVNDLIQVEKKFHEISSANKIILTTEKDMMRLQQKDFSDVLSRLPVFFIPIEIQMNEQDKEAFNSSIISYIASAQKQK